MGELVVVVEVEVLLVVLAVMLPWPAGLDATPEEEGAAPTPLDCWPCSVALSGLC